MFDVQTDLTDTGQIGELAADRVERPFVDPSKLLSPYRLGDPVALGISSGFPISFG